MQTEPQVTTDPEQPVEAAPESWQDMIRQHITGPVFSLAFHIVILILLGTIVVIVPNAGKNDVEPVQIAEMEPVLPPPEEEPTPSDMTVMDASNPSLDRYESNLQQMEDVGVSDVQIMTDIDIATPLTIPDSNSALKLQGVLPFGRPGGGDMGDGGDGDGRGNLRGMLQGVFYDLKQTKGRQPSEDFPNDPGTGEYHHPRVNPTLRIMRAFVNGSWRQAYDKDGQVHYPDLDKYYCSPTRLWTSCFFSEEIPAGEAPKAYQCEKEVHPAAWVCIYSGFVVAPFTGKFRFVGASDDVMFVRFNRQIVLDYGCASFSAGEFWGSSRNANNLNALKGNGDAAIRQKSPLYAKQKLDVYPARGGNNYSAAFDLAKGMVITVKEGEIYQIEVLLSEIPGGHYSQALYIEQLDDNGQPLDPNPTRRTLFRTTLDLPEQPKRDYPEFNPFGPIWRVVRRPSGNGAGAGSSGSGIISQTLTGSRSTPRTARVNEDDDDLSL